MAANRNEHPLIDHTGLSSLRFGEFPALLIRACHGWKLGARRRERPRSVNVVPVVLASTEGLPSFDLFAPLSLHPRSAPFEPT